MDGEHPSGGTGGNGNGNVGGGGPYPMPGVVPVTVRPKQTLTNRAGRRSGGDPHAWLKENRRALRNSITNKSIQRSMQVIEEALEDPDVKVRLVAAQMYLDRAFGKPQAMELVTAEDAAEGRKNDLPREPFNEDNLRKALESFAAGRAAERVPPDGAGEPVHPDHADGEAGPVPLLPG